MMFGFILATGVTLTQPYLAFGAGQSFGRSGSVGTSRMHGQRFGFFGADGFDDQDVTIIQQVQSVPSTEPEPAENRIYVPPHWVDGGYGVQVLQPSYWIDTEKESRR
jgi:hypothetical protein